MPGKNRKSTRPATGSHDPGFPLEIVVAVFDDLLSQPMHRLDTHLLDVCCRIMANGIEIPVTDARELRDALQAQASRKPFRISTGRIILIVLVVAILLAGIGFATGILRWPTRVVKEDDWLSVEVESGYVQPPGPDALSRFGITGQATVFQSPDLLLPQWFPGGYSLVDTTFSEIDDEWHRMQLQYGNGEGTLLLRVDWYGDALGGFATQHELDESLVEVIDSQHDAYLYENLGFVCARWSSAPFTVTVEAENLSRDEIRKIVLSAIRKDV